MTSFAHRCRFCGEYSQRRDDDMIRYDVRHWAHETCYLERRGIDGITPSQVARMPFKELKRLGLLNLAERIVGPIRS